VHGDVVRRTSCRLWSRGSCRAPSPPPSSTGSCAPRPRPLRHRRLGGAHRGRERQGGATVDLTSRGIPWPSVRNSMAARGDQTCPSVGRTTGVSRRLSMTVDRPRRPLTTTPRPTRRRLTHGSVKRASFRASPTHGQIGRRKSLDETGTRAYVEIWPQKSRETSHRRKGEWW